MIYLLYISQCYYENFKKTIYWVRGHAGSSLRYAPFGIPYYGKMTASQAERHALEMDQSGEEEVLSESIIVHKLWKDFEEVDVPITISGHGGGDKKLQDKIFRNPGMADPYKHSAGVRDGAMSLLIGVAARKSIESGKKIRIAELTDLEPRAVRI